MAAPSSNDPLEIWEALIAPPVVIFTVPLLATVLVIEARTSNVAPKATETAGEGIAKELPATRVPALTVVDPLYVFAPFSVRLPVPLLTRSRITAVLVLKIAPFTIKLPSPLKVALLATVDPISIALKIMVKLALLFWIVRPEDPPELKVR